MSQNLKNHSRLIPLWHFITPVLIGGLLGWGIVQFFDDHYFGHMLGASMIVTSIILLFIWWYARWFALRAQDRAIRAEENFRHFIIAGKPLDRKLSMGQIIALRFASDAEFVALAQRAVAENLPSKEIKEAIQNWRADNHRV